MCPFCGSPDESQLHRNTHMSPSFMAAWSPRPDLTIGGQPYYLEGNAPTPLTAADAVAEAERILKG